MFPKNIAERVITIPGNNKVYPPGGTWTIQNLIDSLLRSKNSSKYLWIKIKKQLHRKLELLDLTPEEIEYVKTKVGFYD